MWKTLAAHSLCRVSSPCGSRSPPRGWDKRICTLCEAFLTWHIVDRCCQWRTGQESWPSLTKVIGSPDIVVIRRCQVSRKEKEEHPAAKWRRRRGHHSWGFLKREIFFWTLRILLGKTCRVAVGWPLLFEVIRKLWPSTWKTSSEKALVENRLADFQSTFSAFPWALI